MFIEEKKEFQRQLDEISLQALLLAKLVSDSADKKDQLDQIVRVLDLLSGASSKLDNLETKNG
ncbi:MAG: hypothetical protein H7328_04135 [Bdellovibrio sp.]|nr:hypothetical protein [Bdellovibrio sp.]